MIKLRLGSLVAIAPVLTFSLSATAAVAQQVADLNVAGVRLGMTVDDAQAALLAFDPAMKVIVVYGFLDHDGYVIEKSKIEESPATPADPLVTPIGLLGISLTHIYAADHHEIVNGDDAPVVDVSGEWFSLRFTPNDGGGSLYAVSRSARYPGQDVDRGTLPDAAAFQAKVMAAYGKPTYSNDPDFDWMYDARGKLLGPHSSEYRRCGIPPMVDNSGRSGFALVDQSSGESLGFTRQDLISSLSDIDGRTLGDAENHIASAFDHLNFAAIIENGPQGKDPAQFQKCGVDFQVNIQHDDNTHLDGFTVFLADLDRAYFDNGVQKYLQSKAPNETPAATPKP